MPPPLTPPRRQFAELLNDFVDKVKEKGAALRMRHSSRPNSALMPYQRATDLFMSIYVFSSGRLSLVLSLFS
eukprot:388437-Prorocentrum_minimum.AAC.1